MNKKITLKNENQNTNDNNETTNENENSIKCFCGKIMKNEHGLSIHISKSHKEVRNSQIVEGYQSKNQINNENEQEINGNIERNDEQMRRNIQIEKCNEYMKIILQKLEGIETEFNEDKFNEIYKEFVDVMKTANYENNGPKHPSSKFYEIRKKKIIQEKHCNI